MKYFKQVRFVALTQIFTSIPKEYKDGFTAMTHKINMARFATQCIVLVVMDSIYLIFSLLSLGNFSNLYFENIIVVSIKILLMLIGYFYFQAISKIPYGESNFFRKNMDVIYPMLHFVLEFLFFVTSPENISFFIRMSAVPYICGGIPIIKQSRAFILEAIIFVSFFSYLQFNSQFPPVDNLLAIVNIWLVVFVCANLISFIIYSAHVQNYKLSMLEAEAREKVELASKLDELTRINNRRMIMDYLESEWNNKSAGHTSLSTIIFDIDHFKQLNDTYGHNKGDDCLILIAATVKKITEKHGYEFARYGGEEFLVVGFDKKHLDSVKLAEELRISIERLLIPNENSSVSPTVTASFGVSTQKISSAQHYEKILEWADECLYFAKNAGRNRVAHREDQRSQYRLYGENQKQEHYNSITHNVVEDFRVDYAFIYYKQKNIVKFSKALMELFNIPEQLETPIFENIQEIADIPEEDFRAFGEKLHASLERKAPFFTTEFRVKNSEGSFVWLAITAKCIYSSLNELEAIYGTVFNIEKLEDYQKHIRREREVNPITGMQGRSLFRKGVTAAIEKNNNGGYLLIFDIDDFKAINGYHGHSFGNDVLVDVSNSIKECVNENEEFYHFGTDQFAVIINYDDKARVAELAHCVLDKYNESDVLIEDESVDFTITSTALPFNNKTEINDKLIDIDISIQVAKANHRKEFSYFTEEKREAFLNQVNLEKDLEKAVKRDFEGFVMYYQPLIDATNDKCAGAEALLRWKNYEGNMVPPLQVIPALEKIGYLLQVEQWIIKEACKHCGKFIKAFDNNDFFVHINLVPKLINRSTLIDEIKSAMSENNLSHQNLHFEVTESSPLEGENSTICTLQKLRNLGLKIAIDDFGTGFSSLSYLKTLPIDEIKIDSSFLKNCDPEKQSSSLLHSIINLTKEMGYEICVEGVESSDHYKMIMDENVDLYQGYYFSRPIPFDEFVEMYKP